MPYRKTNDLKGKKMSDFILVTLMVVGMVAANLQYLL
jgi:hypothetical protein